MARRRVSGMPAPTIADVERLLFRHDLMGLTVHGAPADEYSPEARTITPRLADASSAEDVKAVLTEEFATWFSEDLLPPRERFEAPAAELWGMLAPR